MTDDPLAALRPLHLPPPVPWWPPAPGWWLLAILLPALVLLVLWWRRRGAVRRAALRELAALAALDRGPAEQAAAVNRLLKRYVRAVWPETNAAALTGEAWLKFLDDHGGGGAFTRGGGQALRALPYGGSASPAADLIALARRWIKANGAGGRH